MPPEPSANPTPTQPSVPNSSSRQRLLIIGALALALIIALIVLVAGSKDNKQDTSKKSQENGQQRQELKSVQDFTLDTSKLAASTPEFKSEGSASKDVFTFTDQYAQIATFKTRQINYATTVQEGDGTNVDSRAIVIARYEMQPASRDKDAVSLLETLHKLSGDDLKARFSERGGTVNISNKALDPLTVKTKDGKEVVMPCVLQTLTFDFPADAPNVADGVRYTVMCGARIGEKLLQVGAQQVLSGTRYTSNNQDSLQQVKKMIDAIGKGTVIELQR